MTEDRAEGREPIPALVPERSEADGLAMRLTVRIGGEPVELRTLTMDESDAWLRTLTGSVDVDIGSITGDAESLARLLSIGAHAGLDVIAAYDVEGSLPEGWRSRMTKREVKAAVEAMADAEDPFGEGAVRLVDEVFGAPSRFLEGLAQVMTETVASQMVASANGASDSGASTTTETFDASGAASDSSSSGPTGKTAKRKRRRRSETLSPTG